MRRGDRARESLNKHVFLGLDIAKWRPHARHPHFEPTFVAIFARFWGLRQTPS